MRTRLSKRAWRPIPGLVFQAQGAVGLTDFTLHLSNGIELACR